MQGTHTPTYILQREIVWLTLFNMQSLIYLQLHTLHFSYMLPAMCGFWVGRKTGRFGENISN